MGCLCLSKKTYPSADIVIKMTFSCFAAKRKSAV